MRYVTDGDSVENLQQLNVLLMRSLGENCALLGCYAARSGTLILDSRHLKLGPICCPETSVCCIISQN